MKTYNNYKDIPIDEIKKAFAETKTIQFSARPFNWIKLRQISFGNLRHWIPLTYVLPIIGITPQMLRPVFNPVKKLEKRKFPYGWKWFGLNKNYQTLKESELPQNINQYEELESFPLDKERFRKLAKILKKSIEVWKEDGGTGQHYLLFIINPSEISEHHFHSASDSTEHNPQ